jgi:hypothetical protein
VLRRAGSRLDAPFLFAYEQDWVDDRSFFVIDPSHHPYPGDQASSDGRLAGILSDTSPDQRGRMLLERYEADQARAEGRRPTQLEHRSVELDERGRPPGNDDTRDHAAGGRRTAQLIDERQELATDVIPDDHGTSSDLLPPGAGRYRHGADASGLDPQWIGLICDEETPRCVSPSS